MISVDVALALIQTQIPHWKETIRIPVRESCNKILSEDIISQRDIPRFDNSAMDGYVLSKSDWDAGKRMFEIRDEIRPETANPKEISAGTCSRIMTGAPVPTNGDLVIPVELAEEENGSVRFVELPRVNPIRRKGEGYGKGKIILEKGIVIRPYELGLMIESGNRECTVLKPLRISIQVTGSEVGEDMNTNGPVLSELLKKWPGVELTEWPVLEDDPRKVRQRLIELKDTSDIIITTGGISAGRHDYLYETLLDLGAEYIIRKINQKPGKPFSMALWDGKVVCNLPGNPISAVFSAELYVRTAIECLLGIPTKIIMAKSRNKLENKSDRTLFVPGKMSVVNGELWVEAEAKMSSHLMQLYRNCNVYVQINPSQTVQEGELVRIVPFNG